MTIDPTTVVIRTDPMGGIIGVYSALPITVVKLDTNNVGGKLPTKKLGELKPETVTGVEKMLDPYRHLTLDQRKAIVDAAVENLYDTLNGPSARLAHVKRYVEALSIGDQLEAVSSDEDAVNTTLGFVPETGEEYAEDDAKAKADDDADEDEVLWGRTTTDKVWHAFAVDPAKLPKTDKQVMTRYQGEPMCGIGTIQIVGVIPMPVDDPPHYGGESSLCQTCLAKSKETPAT